MEQINAAQEAGRTAALAEIAKIKSTPEVGRVVVKDGVGFESNDGNFAVSVGGRVQADGAVYDDDKRALGDGAILRRTREGKGALEPQQPVRVGDVELDPATRSVRQNGKPVELTSVEFNLLHALLREAGHVVPRERLVDVVLSRKFSPFDRSIDMHVSKIRKKLGDSEGANDHIKTVRGVGYIFARPPEQSAPPEKLRSSRS